MASQAAGPYSLPPWDLDEAEGMSGDAEIPKAFPQSVFRASGSR
jgi:hypothetical protein